MNAPTNGSRPERYITLARCDRCSRLFFIWGKDPGWLPCYQCDSRPITHHPSPRPFPSVTMFLDPDDDKL